MSFLTVREQAVSVRGTSRFFRACSEVYMQNFWSEPILHLPQDASCLARAMEMYQYLTNQEGYVEGTTVVVALGSGVYEVVGSWTGRTGTTYQKSMSIPFDNLSFVGKSEGETIVHGGFVVENGRKVRFEGLTMKNTSGFGVVAFGVGTKVVMHNVTVKECVSYGVILSMGAKLDAMGCEFHQNLCGVCVYESTTTAHLTNCTSHHNKESGVFAHSGAVVDLMGERTSMHDNERFGLAAFHRGTTINVYQPCVLNDMSHGNKRQNIKMVSGSIVQQKD